MYLSDRILYLGCGLDVVLSHVIGDWDGVLADCCCSLLHLLVDLVCHFGGVLADLLGRRLQRALAEVLGCGLSLPTKLQPLSAMVRTAGMVRTISDEPPRLTRSYTC